MRRKCEDCELREALEGQGRMPGDMFLRRDSAGKR
jgi:hypothetical protein